MASWTKRAVNTGLGTKQAKSRNVRASGPVLQPPRNNKLSLLNKNQTRKPRKIWWNGSETASLKTSSPRKPHRSHLKKGSHPGEVAVSTN